MSRVKVMALAVFIIAMFFGSSIVLAETQSVNLVPQSTNDTRQYNTGVVWSDDFETDKGWQGYGGVVQWERGNPKEGTHSGTNALATALAGDLSSDKGSTGWIESPDIDCSDDSLVFMQFWRLADINRYRDVNEPNAVFYDQAFIHVYNGTNWSELWKNPRGSAISDKQYIPFAFNVTAAAAGNAHFKVRFGLGPTKDVSPPSGWNIDDLTIYSGPIMGGITVQNPSNGDVWDYGVIHTIDWNITAGMYPYTVKIYFSGDGGATYSYKVGTKGQSLDGYWFYNWDISLGSVPPSRKCKIMIFAVDSQGILFTNYSQGFFSLLVPPPIVSVSVPAGGEKWFMGATHAINYSIMSGGWWGKYTVDIYLSYNSGATYPVKIANLTDQVVGGHSYPWDIPMTLQVSSKCRIKVNVTGGESSNENTTKADFTLDIVFGVMLSNPSGGDIWYPKITYTINWTIIHGIAPFKVNLLLAPDGTSFTTTIVSGMDQSVSGSGSYIWKIPGTTSPSTYAKIKVIVTDSNSSNAESISDAFEIGIPRGPVAEIVSPLGKVWRSTI
jgi:hypothetical protein